VKADAEHGMGPNVLREMVEVPVIWWRYSGEVGRPVDGS
jgi:hypothetical protein